MTTTQLRRGDIVLVPFPFTDLTGLKLRPAIVISPDPIREDLLLGFISTVIPPMLEPTEYVLEITDPSFGTTGLKARSVFRMNKIATLHRSMVLRRLGRSTLQLQRHLDAALRHLVGLSR